MSEGEQLHDNQSQPNANAVVSNTDASQFVPETNQLSEKINQNDEDDRKEEEEEEEEDDEEDRIVEQSTSGRFHKRNKRFPRHVPGTDNAYVAIEPKSGKEVIWNEIDLPEKKTEYENRFLSVIKRLKKTSHPFLIRFLDAWVAKMDSGKRKMVFVTERLDEATLKQFMCNSERSNRLWKRHVGQLLSVLKFLGEVGVMHGNLTNETIYYQSSGNLKIGTFAMVDLFNVTESRDDVVLKARKKYLAPEYDDPDPHITPAVDIYALGVISLELIVWDLADQTNENGQAKSYTDIIESEVHNPYQKDFIRSCLAVSPDVRPSLNSLINHPAMIEVPTLKLLSARVIVDHFRLNVEETQGETSTSSFANLLRDYSSYLEDDTVVLEIYISSDNFKTRAWKDFRSNFTLTSKYLEDVKNNFYPFFGCIPPSTRKLHEENDDVYCLSLSPENCQTSGNEDGKISNIITPSGSNHGLSHDSGPRSREDEGSFCSQENPTVGLTGPGNAASLGGIGVVKLPDTGLDKPSSVKTDSLCGTFVAGVDTLHGADYPHSVAQLSLKEDGLPIKSPHPLDVIDDQSRSKPDGTDGFLASNTPRPPGPVSVTAGVDSSNQPDLNQKNCLSMAQESTDNIETSVNDDDDEDEDEIERNKKERPNEPQLVHVAPPMKAPLHQALFTHCEYTYVGCGRWQIYIQMWFVEDRLKREGFVQVLDFEWHNIEYVASLFEASRSIAPEDKHRLMRLLDCARHSWPLIDGELKPPRSQLANFDAFDLHEKLMILQQHQQARDIYDAVNNPAAAHESDGKTQNEHNDSHKNVADTSENNAKSQNDGGVPAPTSIPNPDELLISSSLFNPPKGLSVSNISPNRTDDYNDSNIGPAAMSSKNATSVPASVSEPSKNLLKGMKVGQLEKLNLGAMIDVGVLAPRNHECAICDKHDYLHCKDLPAYLTSPCYHCREALASEAKLTPEALYDAHLQHQIPWPAFLQARFGIPQDERTFDELITYDCRWRSRPPCHCYSSSTLPPCVEFPWLYQGVTNNQSVTEIKSIDTVSVVPEPTHACVDNLSDAEIDKRVLDNDVKTPVASDNPPPMVSSVSAEVTRPDSATSAHKISGSLSHSTSPAPADINVAQSTGAIVSGGPAKPTTLNTFSNYLPCSSRHEKGAPMTCSHGYNFPNLVSCHLNNARKASRI